MTGCYVMWLIPKTDEIKQRRLKKGLTRHKLSIDAGLGSSALFRIESKTTRKVNHLSAREIARVLNCDVYDIFDELPVEKRKGFKEE